MSESPLPPLGVILEWTPLSYSCRWNIGFLETHIWVLLGFFRLWFACAEWSRNQSSIQSSLSAARSINHPDQQQQWSLSHAPQPEALSLSSLSQGGLFFYTSSPSHGWCIWAYYTQKWYLRGFWVIGQVEKEKCVRLVFVYSSLKTSFFACFGFDRSDR